MFPKPPYQIFALAALQISAAVTYLHEHSIIYRDLKPQNIGFDVRGDGKKTKRIALNVIVWRMKTIFTSLPRYDITRYSTLQ